MENPLWFPTLFPFIFSRLICLTPFEIHRFISQCIVESFGEKVSIASLAILLGYLAFLFWPASSCTISAQLFSLLS